ncbi:NeuD/PglB/VioB family sugar acetyltransferase [Sulfurimonas sp.]
MKKEIILLGGGGHCKSVIDVIEQAGEFRVAGIIEKFVGESSPVLGYELIGVDDELEKLRQKYEYAFVTIGHIHSNSVRVKLFKKLKELDFTVPTIISPLAYVSKHATLQEGTVVMHHALINAGVKVGKNCIINSKALLEHDVLIEDNVHISTNATLNGSVRVKANSFVGSSSVTKEGVLIDGFVKMGSVIK